MTGGFLAILIFTDLPRIPLLMLGGGVPRHGAACSTAAKRKIASDADKPRPTTTKPSRPKSGSRTISPSTRWRSKLGVGLIRLADPKRGGDLLERMQRVRQNVAGEIGIIMPKVRIRDNMRLDAQQYRIKIADMPVAQGDVEPGMLLAIDSGMTTGQVDGIATNDPAFGTDANWIDPAAATQAEMYGYTVVEPGAVLATHLTEVCRRHADEILTRDATKHLVDELKKTSPAVVDELIPERDDARRGASAFCRCCCASKCPIRQLALILETLGDHAPRSKDPILLTEYVRHRLARQICTRYRNAEGRAVRHHARPGAGRSHSRRLRAQRARHVHPHVAASGRSDLPRRSPRKLEKLTTPATRRSCW